MNHIIIKCNLDRGCIDYGTMELFYTWNYGLVTGYCIPRPAELNRVAMVQSFSAGIGNANDYLFGFLKSNSRLEIWLIKLCLLTGRRCRFVDFGLRL